ncbi:unnamed protein product [Blepharisma stoltei]|uniref:Uncharacterized protein n=1 Tax=Blepharisma stoltei TaxID=1481888 RepID=A0AAU9J4Y1_9CILI|nr:unnamed protein product [Blepharisma stoltei]
MQKQKILILLILAGWFFLTVFYSYFHNTHNNPFETTSIILNSELFLDEKSPPQTSYHASLNYFDDENSVFPLDVSCKPDTFGYTLQEAKRWFEDIDYPRCETLYNSTPGVINIDIEKNVFTMNCSGYFVLGNRYEEIGSYTPTSRRVYHEPVKLKSEEYAFGTCSDTKTKDFEHFVYKFRPEPLALERAEKALKGKPLNIVMLVIDSLSRRNFLRKLPKSVEFLKNLDENYSIFDFKMNNVMGRDSHHFYMPALFGDIKYKINLDYRGDLHTEKSIWRYLHQNGFVSLLGTDICGDSVSMFLGKNPKVDHIMGTIFCAAKKYYGYHQDKTSERCIGNKNVHAIMMDHILKFSEAYRNVSRFTYMHINTGHEPTGTVISTLDLDLVEFLRSILSRNEDLILFIKGDHGSRHGGWLKTSSGVNEHRIPLTFLIASNSFLSKIPKSIETLIQNSNKLISNYDFHSTLIGLGNFSQEDISSMTSIRFKSYNLFTEIIPDNRTCIDAGINLTWCSCLPVEYLQDSEFNSPFVLKIVYQVILKLNLINNCIGQSDTCVCKFLTLETILKAGVIEYDGDAFFKLTFKVRESQKAIFRADVRLSKEEMGDEVTADNDLFKAKPIKFDDYKFLKILNVNRLDQREDECKYITEKYEKDPDYCLCGF